MSGVLVLSVRRNTAASWWLLCTVSCLLICSSVQEEVYFKTEPRPYYYSYPNHITLIQCMAVKVDAARDEIPIATTLYRNSERINTVFPPDRHGAYVYDGVVAGVVVYSTQYEDAGVRYHCEVEEGGEVVATSRETELLVGDGHPLSVEGVVQLDQYLYSVALKWNESRVPADSPILGYEITVIPEDQGSASFTVEVEYNMTATELSPLEPASTYLVTVAGLNSHGKGTASTHVTIMTFVPEVPRPPTNVMVIAHIGTTSTSMTVTWTPTPIDPEAMTPLMSYVIYYGTEDSREVLSSSVVVPDGAVSEFTVSGITVGGNVSVGVAAVNSAGSSQVAYYEHHVGVGCGVLSAPEHGTVSQTGLAKGSVGNYSCEQGFTLSVNETRVCLDQGVWSGDQPTCIGVGCGVLSAPEHGTVSQTGLAKGSVGNYSCEQGFTLSVNETRVCLGQGVWSGDQPTCIELPSEIGSPLSSKMMIIVTSIAVIVVLVLTITLVTIVIVVVKCRMKSERVIATGTFDNASPPLKRQKKPHNLHVGVTNDVFEAPSSHVTLSILTEEPRTFGTPPLPESTTFQETPSPPSSIPPPSYSDLDLPNTNSGITNQHPNSSPPHENSVMESFFEESTDSALSVQYSTEPRAAGHSPSRAGSSERRREETEGGGRENNAPM